MNEEKARIEVSRRDFVIGASGFVAGTAVGAVLGGGVFDLFPAKAEAVKAPAWPWPYAKLDAESARKKAYELYFEGG